MKLMISILEALYGISFLRRPVLKALHKMQKDEIDNAPLRRVFKKYHNISIGECTYGGCFDLERIPSGTTIGRFCSFASEVMIIPSDHLMSAVSTHPFLFKPELGVTKKDPRPHSSLTIGHDVWVGYRVTILPSVKEIGHGAVLAAGAVVTRDVPPYAVVAGVPAKIIKYRFNDEMISKLLDICWWDWPQEKIMANWQAFLSSDKFITMAKDEGIKRSGMIKDED